MAVVAVEEEVVVAVEVAVAVAVLVVVVVEEEEEEEVVVVAKAKVGSWRAAHLGIDRAREERLARARRAVEEHAARRRHTQPVEDLWVLERQVDELVHLVRVKVRVSYG